MFWGEGGFITARESCIPQSLSPCAGPCHGLGVRQRQHQSLSCCGRASFHCHSASWAVSVCPRLTFPEALLSPAGQTHGPSQQHFQCLCIGRGAGAKCHPRGSGAALQQHHLPCSPRGSASGRRRLEEQQEPGAHGRVAPSLPEHRGGPVAVARGEPVLLLPSPLPAQSVPGSSSLSNEKALPVGKIQDKIVLEQPRRRAVITVSCAYSKHKTPVVFSP